MTNLTRLALLATAALGSLTACGDSKKTPEGQVVATIDGKDITIHEVNAEIGLLPNRGGDAPRKLIESVALARVIERRMLADEAQKRKLDKNPQFLLARQRVEEGLLVQALQGDIQQKVIAATRESAQKFVAENPSIFGDRKIFTIDQIQFLRPANINDLPFKEAKTMAAVERILTDANIEFRRAPQQLDSLTTNPALVKEVTKLSDAGNGEPFMFVDQPAGAPAPVIYVNNVTSTKTQPFTGEKAISYAQNILQRQEVQKRLASELKAFQDSYKSKIVYAKGYGPPQLPKPAGAPAPGTAPGAAKPSAAAAPATPAPAPAATPAAPAAAK